MGSASWPGSCGAAGTAANPGLSAPPFPIPERSVRMNPWLEQIYARSPVILQDAYVSWYGERIRRQRFGSEYDRWMTLFDKSQWWSEQEIGAYQDDQLAAMVRHCYESVPFYRGAMEARRLRPA